MLQSRDALRCGRKHKQREEQRRRENHLRPIIRSRCTAAEKRSVVHIGIFVSRKQTSRRDPMRAQMMNIVQRQLVPKAPKEHRESQPHECQGHTEGVMTRFGRIAQSFLEVEEESTGVGDRNWTALHLISQMRKGLYSPCKPFLILGQM